MYKQRCELTAKLSNLRVIKQHLEIQETVFFQFERSIFTLRY